MPDYFTVLPHGARIPKGVRNRAFLWTDNWNDWWEFTTMYVLVVFDEAGEEHRVGEVKIGQFGMQPEQRRANLDQTFDELGEEFFSLGQDTSYYEKLNEFGPERRDRILRGLRDVARDQELFVRALDEKVMGVSLLRGVTRATVQGQFARLATGGARLSRYAFQYQTPIGRPKGGGSGARVRCGAGIHAADEHSCADRPQWCRQDLVTGQDVPIVGREAAG